MNALSKAELLRDDLHDFLNQCLTTEDFHVYALAGDASSRKYYRIVQQENSYVLMSWDPFIDDNKYPFLSVLHHFERNSIHVPQVIGKCPQRGLVLLEDLGDLTLERKFWESTNQELVLPYYQLAVDEIIKIHCDSTKSKSDCTAFNIAFDIDKFVWELNYAREHYLEKFLQIKFTPAEVKTLQDTFLQIASELHQEPKVICHRDYHSRNLMFKLGKMFVIDFQDARLGPIQYDLVSLLKDSYVNLETKTQEQILAYYFEQWHQKMGTKIDLNHFDSVYSTQIIQRCFKACGSFASFFNLRNDTRYLKYLRKTTQTVLTELSKNQKFPILTEILGERVLHHPTYMAL